MIGDANPHAVGYKYGSIKNDLDWKNELTLLLEAGVNVYAVQALGRRGSDKFYNTMASLAGTPKLSLEQFSDINDIITALCMTRAGKLPEFNKTLESRRNVSYSVMRTVESLGGKRAAPKRMTAHSMFAVHPSRFQILYVDRDCSIKDFVQENGLRFNIGRGFYEFTKSVVIQDYKEVIIQDKRNGEMFSGEKAREILGIPIGITTRVSPAKLTDYRGFVQSTSSNRKLLEDTHFLYELDDWSEA